MKKALIIGIWILSCLSVPAQQYMSLKQARDMALAKSEDLKIAEAMLVKSEYEQKAARTNYLPSVSASATGVYFLDKLKSEYYLPTYSPNEASGAMEPNLAVDELGQPLVGADGNPLFNMYAYLPLELSLQGAYLATVKLEQPIYAGGKITSGNRMADLALGMAADNLEIQRMKTVVEADQTYWLYVSAQSKVKLAKENLDLLEALLKRVRDNREVGLIQENDVLKVQVEYDKARLDFQKAKNGMELARMSLCRVTGLEFDTQIQTDSLININAQIPLGLEVEDVTGRPEYHLLKKNVELEHYRLANVRSDYLPTLGISAGYIYFGRVELNDDLLSMGTPNVLAQLNIPLFNWGEGRKKVAIAREERSIKEQQLDKNKGLMQLEIELTKFSLKEAALLVEISEQGVKQAAENLRVSKNSYEVGRELLTDLLTAQTQWAKASNELIEAKINFKLKETEYLRVTAQLLSVATAE